MRKRKVQLGVAVALLCALGTWTATRKLASRRASGRRTEESLSAAAAHPSAARTPAPASGTTNAVTKISRSEREQLRAAIQSARQEAEALAPRAQAPERSAAPSGEPEQLNAENIRKQIAEAVPLLAECYQLERDKAPDLSGKLKTRFSIDGEPDVGGLVTNFEVIGGELADRAEFTTCIRETLYTLKFPAPKAGGTTTVEYPLVFSSK